MKTDKKMKTEDIKEVVEQSAFGVGRVYALKMVDKIEKLEAEIKELKKGQILPIEYVRDLLPTSKAVKDIFSVDNNWSTEDKTHAIGKRQGAFWVINTVLNTVLDKQLK